MAIFGHRARLFPKNMVCGFFNISVKVSVTVLTDLKQNCMHMCCLIRSVIFWRTGHCLVHNIQSCIIGHCFIMTSAKTQKPDCKDSTLLHLWVNCVLTAVMSSCIQLRIVLITPHICSSLRKAHDVTVPSIFF